MKKFLCFTLGTVLGIGYLPFAPGTFGSLAAILTVYFTSASDMVGVVVIIVLSVIGIIASTYIEKSKGHDAGIIVIDEYVGQWISVLFLPRTILVLILGFILFRIFDIVKPYPVNKSQSLKAGWGVMADDILAGLISNIILQLILFTGMIK